MVQYVNAFSLRTNEEHSEVILKFSQTFPDGSGSAPLFESVADIIMPGNLAQELIAKLQSIMAEEE